MAFRETSLETTAPPAAVWRVWSDVNHWPEWNPDMNASRLDGPLAMGTRGMIDTKSGGKHDVVVTRCEEHCPARHEDGNPCHRRADRRRQPDRPGLRTARTAGAHRGSDDERDDSEDVRLRTARAQGEGRSAVSAFHSPSATTCGEDPPRTRSWRWRRRGWTEVRLGRHPAVGRGQPISQPADTGGRSVLNPRACSHGRRLGHGEAGPIQSRPLVTGKERDCDGRPP